MANQITVSERTLVIIGMIIAVLLIITASMGIWLANGYDNFSSAEQENGVKGWLITVLVLSLVLPTIYLLMAFKPWESTPK